MSTISPDDGDAAGYEPGGVRRLVCTERDRLLDAAAGAVREVATSAFARAVLLQHLLATVLPEEAFTVRLGALRITPSDGSSSVALDPRGPDGLEGGVHAWLEDAAGRVHDVAILSELAAAGLAVDRDQRVDGMGRSFQRGALRFHYEEIAELELLHLADSGDWVRSALLLSATGELPPGEGPLACPLAVGWRTGL